MPYNDSKSKKCGGGSAADEHNSRSQSSSLSEKEENDDNKKELKKIKDSINNMRYKMYKTAKFNAKENIVITDETVEVSQELDIIIVEYYRKNKI